MGSARINAIRQRIAGIPDPNSPEGDDLVNRITKKLMGIQKKQDQIDPRRGNPLGMRGDITTPLIKEVPFGPEKYPLGPPSFGDAKSFDHIDSNLLTFDEKEARAKEMGFPTYEEQISKNKNYTIRDFDNPKSFRVIPHGGISIPKEQKRKILPIEKRNWEKNKRLITRGRQYRKKQADALEVMNDIIHDKKESSLVRPKRKYGEVKKSVSIKGRRGNKLTETYTDHITNREKRKIRPPKPVRSDFAEIITAKQKSARVEALRQRLAEEFDVTKDLERDLDWDDIFIRSGEINFEKGWASQDQRETERKWNFQEEYPDIFSPETVDVDGIGPGIKEMYQRGIAGMEDDPMATRGLPDYWFDKAGKRHETESSYVDVGSSDKRLYEYQKYRGIPQLQDSFMRKGLVPSGHKFPDFDQGIEGLKGSDNGFMSPKGMWFGASTIMDENELNDFDELAGADSLTEWLNSAKKAGLINEQTVEKYSMEDGVLDFYEDTGFGMTRGRLGNMDSSENKLYWDSPKMPTPQQTATFKKMIETNRVNPENVHINIWNPMGLSGRTNNLDELKGILDPQDPEKGFKEQVNPDEFRESLKLKKYKPIYTDIQGYQVTPAAYKRITESGVDPMSDEYGYDPQDPGMIEHNKYRAEHPENFPSAEQMKEVRKQADVRKEEKKKQHYKQRAKKYGGKSARIEALRQRMAYDPPEEDILGSDVLEKADAFEIHKQPHNIPPSRLMKKKIHAKDKAGAAFENILGGDDVNQITGEEYKSQLDEIIRKGFIGENVDRTKKYRLDRTNKMPHQRVKDVAQGWTRDYIQKHKLAKQRLGIKYFNEGQNIIQRADARATFLTPEGNYIGKANPFNSRNMENYSHSQYIEDIKDPNPGNYPNMGDYTDNPRVLDYMDREDMVRINSNSSGTDVEVLNEPDQKQIKAIRKIFQEDVEGFVDVSIWGMGDDGIFQKTKVDNYKDFRKTLKTNEWKNSLDSNMQSQIREHWLQPSESFEGRENLEGDVPDLHVNRLGRDAKSSRIQTARERLGGLRSIPTSKVEGDFMPGEIDTKGDVSEFSKVLRNKKRMNYSAEDRHQRPRGVSAPYNIIKEQKDMTIGDIIPKDEDFKRIDEYMREHHMNINPKINRPNLLSDPNIAAYTKINAKKWAKLKQRIAVITGFPKKKRRKFWFDKPRKDIPKVEGSAGDDPTIEFPEDKYDKESGAFHNTGNATYDEYHLQEHQPTEEVHIPPSRVEGSGHKDSLFESDLAQSMGYMRNEFHPSGRPKKRGHHKTPIHRRLGYNIVKERKPEADTTILGTKVKTDVEEYAPTREQRDFGFKIGVPMDMRGSPIWDESNPNIATISKVNARRYSKLRQRIGRL